MGWFVLLFLVGLLASAVAIGTDDSEQDTGGGESL